MSSLFRNSIVMMFESEGEMSDQMMTIWVVDDPNMDNPVLRLVDSLGYLLSAKSIMLEKGLRISCKIDEGDLLLKCLKASGLKMMVEYYPLPVVEKVDTVLAVAEENLDRGDVVRIVDAPVVEANAPVCEICGEAFEAKRKDSTVCGKKDCRMEKQRRYARDYAKKHPLKKVLEEESPVEETVDKPLYIRGEANPAFPYKVIDGSDAGRTVTVETMELWLKIGRLPAGTMVEHFQRGRYMVDKKPGGKKGMTLRKVVEKKGEA